MYNCKYCNKICKNKNSLAQHEIRCKSNPHRIKIVSNFKKYNEDCRTGLIKKSYSNQYIKAKELGLPKPEITDETRKKLSNVWSGRKHTIDEIKKISESMHKAVLEHPDSYNSQNVCGRVKKVKYKDILLDSKWELIVAEYLDSLSIEWYKPKEGHKYIYKNREHLYFPDFYLPKYNVFIEVKGYQRESDEYKWKVLNNLIVIKQDDINKILRKEYKLPFLD